jgi:hypothetical protein
MIVLGEQTLGEELFSASQLDIKQQRIIKVWEEPITYFWLKCWFNLDIFFIIDLAYLNDSGSNVGW